MFHIVLAGCLTLAIAMGIGRFAYTPIFPLMQAVLPFSDAYAGFLASSNYLGYLLGAILAGIIQWGNRKVYYLKIHLVLNIASTLAMGFSTQFSLWMVFRFISGVSSGLIFVLASSILLDFLTKHGRASWSGYFFSGTGLGIALTGVLVPILATYYTWTEAWLGLGIVSTLMCFYIFKVVREDTFALFMEAPLKTGSLTAEESKQKQSIQHEVSESDIDTSRNKRMLNWLILAYGCEGVGYIITGTFMVAMVSETVAFTHASSISWTLVGLAAIPSCVLWAQLGARWGNFIAIKVAYVVQAVGIILPILSTNVAVIFIGAILFGGTFMGIATLVLSIARELFPKESSRPIGYLTAAYGVGQIIGPIVAGILVSMTGNYVSAVIFAVLILLIGLAFLSIAWFIYSQKVRKSATL